MESIVDVAIIGAGFAGLSAAIRLKQTTDAQFVVFERGREVGGTWRDNAYPGAGCDTPSPLYSLSFAPNPNWSRLFSKQPEIFGYLKNMVDQFGLRPHIRYQTEIKRTEFVEADGHWRLTDQDGHVTTARAVVLAIGPLNRPMVPNLPGLVDFRGKTFHSSAWDHQYELRGKRVAVIGTGASAIQFVPEIAPVVDQLFVFQRTAPYIHPRLDRIFSATEQRRFARVPLLQRLHRTALYWKHEFGGLMFLGNKTLGKLATDLARRHLESQISDPDLRRRATPDYRIGCKRILLSDEYYPALTRPNVELVTDGIAEIRAHAIVDRAGVERSVDAIIFGTGFVASEILVDLRVTGLGGQNLFDQWQPTGPEAYLGTTVAGYPNLLILIGPNTGLGHNSLIHVMESQVNYVLDYLSVLKQAGDGAYLNVKADAQRAYNEYAQQRLATTVWGSGCQSWYQDSRGKITTLLPMLTARYRRLTRRVNPADYVLTRPKSVSVPA